MKSSEFVCWDANHHEQRKTKEEKEYQKRPGGDAYLALVVLQLVDVVDHGRSNSSGANERSKTFHAHPSSIKN